VVKDIDLHVIENTRVQRVFFSLEALEVAVVLTSGEVILYRLRDETTVDVAPRALQDDQLLSLEHVAVAPDLRFKPYFMIKSKGLVTTLAITDIGKWSHQRSKPSVRPIFSRVSRCRICQWCTNRG